MGLDIRTLGEPESLERRELFDILRRDDVDPFLMVHEGDDVPTTWMRALETDVLHKLNYETFDRAGRMLDTTQFWVTTEVNGELRSSSACNFFGAYADLDRMQAQERGDDDLAAEDRYRAAALAAAGTSLNVDVIVTNAPTAGRPDVADNDILISVRPEDLIPIFGHYLRSIGESRFRIVKGHLVGGGAIESTTGAHSVNELYEMGIDSGMRFFECLLLVSGMARHQSVASALRSIRTRINRAARALDSLLAALSNTNGSGEQTSDATEWAAEAFDRELLYLTAVYDSYGRLYLTLLNQDLRLQDARGTLHSEKFLNDQVEPHFDPALLTDLRSLQQYAYVCASCGIGSTPVCYRRAVTWPARMAARGR